MNNNLNNNMTNYLIHKDCIIIEKTEYDNLIKENNELKIELNALKTNNNILMQNQVNNLLIIETLKNENKELKDVIELLKNENKELKDEINLLKKENSEFKCVINSLKNENIKLTNKINKLEDNMNNFMDKDYIKKIILVCQDLNAYDQLETKFKKPLNQKLVKLRVNRNDDCHLILSTDSNDVILCKEKIFCERLKTLTMSQRTLLDKKIGSDLVNEIIKYLESKSYTSILSIFNSHEVDINEWFDE